MILVKRSGITVLASAKTNSVGRRLYECWRMMLVYCGASICPKLSGSLQGSSVADDTPTQVWKIMLCVTTIALGQWSRVEQDANKNGML